jgi:hypothetical protein
MFLRSVAVQERAISADGIETFDLAVNPLSMVMLCLRPLNDTGTLANYARYRSVCAALNRVSILYRGESIISARGEDMAALNFLRHGILPAEANPDNVDNERRCVVLPIMLGRWPYSKTSCFPATRRGELTLECDFDIADTGYDGLRFSVETVEILDAKPAEYEKKVQITQTFGATGDQDFDLPPGNLSRGLLLFGTTGFAGANPAPSWGRIKVLLDNQEAGFASTDWECVMGDTALWGRQPYFGEHKHTVNAAGAGVEETTSVFDVAEDFTQYAWLDFDPTGDDTHALDTRNRSRFHIRANAETADAVRVLPIEVIKLTGGQSA